MYCTVKIPSYTKKTKETTKQKSRLKVDKENVLFFFYDTVYAEKKC